MATLPTSSPDLPPTLELGDSAYLTSDGRPLGETDLHREVMVDLIATLEQFYEGQKVYVSGNLLVHCVPGNKRRHVAPDVLVTKGLQPGSRKNYILWQEGSPPNVVFEVTSASTRTEDLTTKFEIYQDQIRIPEYFLFDPEADYLQPPLQGFRLLDAKYVPIAATANRLVSEQLGLELETSGHSLRLYDRESGRRLLTPREELAQLRAEVEQLRRS
jgi:Uma2 family endonuclease